MVGGGGVVVKSGARHARNRGGHSDVLDGGHVDVFCGSQETNEGGTRFDRKKCRGRGLRQQHQSLYTTYSSHLRLQLSSGFIPLATYLDLVGRARRKKKILGRAEGQRAPHNGYDRALRRPRWASREPGFKHLRKADRQARNATNKAAQRSLEDLSKRQSSLQGMQSWVPP